MSDTYLFPEIQQEEILKKRKLAYMPSYYIFASLPLREPKINKNTFQRKYGKAFMVKMSLTSGKGVPYGKDGRLMMAHFTTEAVVRKNAVDSDKIVLKYSSIKKLLDVLGLPAARGKEVMDQLERFSTCMMSFEFKRERKYEFQDGELLPESFPEEAGRKGTMIWENIKNVPFFSDVAIVTIREDKNDKGLPVRIEITLSREFVEMAQKHSIPIDYTIYKAITSPLGKDIYAWFVYKNNAPIAEDGIHITRKMLVDQFYPDEKGFEPQYYARIIEEVKNIKEKYYKDLNVSITSDKNGIILKKSPAVIQSDDVRYVPMIYNVE